MNAIIENYHSDALGSFRNYKKLAERAVEQISDEEFFAAIDDEANSIAVIIKHIAGNLRSPVVRFLIADGEKPDRDRDMEFEIAGDTRPNLMEYWEASWQSLFDAKAAPAKEAEARAKLATIPGVGPVTVDVVVSELGDVSRFHSVKAVCAYAGLVPRGAAERRQEVEGPGDHQGRARRCCGGRWWRRPGGWSGRGRRGGGCTSRIKKEAGGKKAIVAVARRLLVVMAAMLRDGTNYNFLKVGEPRPT